VSGGSGTFDMSSLEVKGISMYSGFLFIPSGILDKESEGISTISFQVQLKVCIHL
jgi:hypothetical protein